ncbi:MAG: hypothetical protein Crog4KO_19530 [Crocinitomicaceae bacterium]
MNYMENNTYLMKALDAYPYDLEEAVEALNYALSYEPNNGQALCLMGRLYLEIYRDYNSAINYFEKALEDNLNMHALYGHYSLALLCAEEFDKADKFLDFAISVKGSDKGLLYSLKAGVLESKQQFAKAKKVLKKARLYTYNDGFMFHMDDMESRLDKKIKLTKKKSKSKSNNGKKAKKKKK